MTVSSLGRILIALAGLFGSAGVILAAMAAHAPDAARLAPASTMLLFHALAALAAVLLAGNTLVSPWLGTLAACGFLVGTLLFSGTITVHHFSGHGLFPMAAPTGGTILIASWLVLAVAALWHRAS